MAALQARFDAGQSGDAGAWWQGRAEIAETLRAELGESGYERYLEANGRSTSVTVGTVIESSPAERAGLMPGDRITRYSGERIFGMSELTRQTMEGTPGQQVVVDIVRDGQPMQVVIPRGPLGISGGRRFDGG
jgi:S1-C subfamily serine protease